MFFSLFFTDTKDWQIILLRVSHVKNKHKSIKHVITLILTNNYEHIYILKMLKREL